MNTSNNNQNTEQWFFMMNYCKKTGVNPTDGWRDAEKAWFKHLALRKQLSKNCRIESNQVPVETGGIQKLK